MTRRSPLAVATLFSHVQQDDRADWLLAVAVAALSALAAPRLYWAVTAALWG